MNTFATRSSSCYVDGTQSRRITREEVITLRNISVVKKPITHKLVQVFHACLRDLSNVLMAPVKKEVLNNSMCKYYGHIIQGPWKGHLPKCGDCGCEISSPDQLRKAAPRH